MLKIFFSFLAGILTIGAPCVLPLLPILLGTSIGHTGKMRPLYITLGFIITFSAVALIFTLFTQVSGISQDALRMVALIMLIIFGIFMIWPLPMEKLSLYLGEYTNKANEISEKSGSGNFGGFVLGVMLGIIWTPCAGPVLGSIITLIVISHDLTKATGMLVAYAIGAGIPMLLIAYGGQYITNRVRGFSKYTRLLQQVFGVLILLLAVAIYFQYDVKIQDKLAQLFPGTLAIEKKLVEKFDKEHKLHSVNAFPEDEEVIEDPYFDDPEFDATEEKSPEIKLDLSENNFAGRQPQNSANTQNYFFPEDALKPGTYALAGNWKSEAEKIISVKKNAKIKIRFRGKTLKMQAAAGKNPVKLIISENEKMINKLTVRSLNNYILLPNAENSVHEIEIEAENAGLEAYYFSFE